MSLDKIIRKLKKNKIFLISALEVETMNSVETIYSGVGKVNAAICAIETIKKYSPTKIINYGTAGKLNTSLHGIIRCNRFIQHDIDASPLGFKKGETPYDEINKISFRGEGHICATGDYFINKDINIKADVVDMEAYAIAKACYVNNIDFECYKYITDSANEEASTDWIENCNKGVSQLIPILEKIT